MSKSVNCPVLVHTIPILTMPWISRWRRSKAQLIRVHTRATMSVERWLEPTATIQKPRSSATNSRGRLTSLRRHHHTAQKYNQHFAFQLCQASSGPHCIKSISSRSTFAPWISSPPFSPLSFLLSRNLSLSFSPFWYTHAVIFRSIGHLHRYCGSGDLDLIYDIVGCPMPAPSKAIPVWLRTSAMMGPCLFTSSLTVPCASNSRASLLISYFLLLPFCPSCCPIMIGGSPSWRFFFPWSRDCLKVSFLSNAVHEISPVTLSLFVHKWNPVDL